MRKCKFYLHGRPSQFLTDLYNALERPNPNINTIHEILKDNHVIQQHNGKMFIRQGEDSSIALNHVRRINRRYPNLIRYEYKGQTTNKFGKGLNEKYTFDINPNVLSSIKNMTFPEDIEEVFTESPAPSSDEALATFVYGDPSMPIGEGSLDEPDLRGKIAAADTRNEKIAEFKARYPEGELIFVPGKGTAESTLEGIPSKYSGGEILFRRNPGEDFTRLDSNFFKGGGNEFLSDFAEFVYDDAGVIFGEILAGSNAPIPRSLASLAPVSSSPAPPSCAKPWSV